MKQIGDIITRKFPDDFIFKSLAGKTFDYEITDIDYENKCYYVYTDYGQDIIDFEE